MELLRNGEGKNVSNKQGERKVSKTGRKRKYQIKGETGNASNKQGILNCLQLPTIAYNSLQFSKRSVSIQMAAINLKMISGTLFLA